jgi:hypothetical protein
MSRNYVRSRWELKRIHPGIEFRQGGRRHFKYQDQELIHVPHDYYNNNFLFLFSRWQYMSRSCDYNIKGQFFHVGRDSNE